MIGCGFIHLILTDSNAFLFTVYMHHNFFIHSSVSGHLDCFHVLAIVTVLQSTLGYLCLFQLWFSHSTCSVVGLLGHTVVLFLVFLGISILALSICIPTNNTSQSLSSTPSPALILCRFFDNGHSDQYEMIPHYSFDLHLSDNEQC